MLKLRSLILILLLAPLLQNCTGSSSGGGGSTASSQSTNTTPPTGSNPTGPNHPGTSDPNPVPVECSGTGENLADKYNTSVTNHVVNQDDIAKACVDSSSDYQSNINFQSTDTFRVVRFQTTCAARWCDQHLNESATVGVINSDIFWNGSSLDLAAVVQVQCRSSKSELAVDPCSENAVPQKPLETFSLGYDDPRCSYCGCDVGTVSGKWGQSKQALIDCGTAFCKGEDSGFHWGILSEVNTSQFAIRCSRATVQ